MNSFLEKTKLLFQSKILFWLHVFLFVGFLEFWQWHLIHHISWTSIGMFGLLGTASLLYGKMFLQLVPLSFREERCYVIELLFGFFVFNTLLFFFAWATSLTLAAVFFILAAVGLFLPLYQPKTTGCSQQAGMVSLLVLCLSGIAATLWCADSLTAPSCHGSMITFPVWIDGFMHARFISALAQAHGLKNLSSILMAETPTPIYHYASYAISSAIMPVAQVSSYDLFASLLLPLGIMLSGLAAFALGTTLWGMWPGVAAVVGVFFLPDAFQQGFGNKFLSYQFVQQIGPAGLYATAFIALAWILMLTACRHGKYQLVFWSYLFLLLSVFYKAHLFVANAYLIMIYPCFFFSQLRERWRFFLGTIFTALFVSVIFISRNFSSVPLLTLDRSGMHQYAEMLLYSCANQDAIRAFFVKLLITPPLPSPAFEMVMGGMLLLCTLGLWALLCGVVLFLMRHKESKATLAFPIFMIVNYLIMAIGLPYKENILGTPEELLHRPLVWVYFAVAVWTSAGLYFLIFGNRLPQQTSKRLLLVVLLLASTITPFHFAHELQRMPVWQNPCGPLVIPVEVVTIAKYIRDHSQSSEIIQNSIKDPEYVTTGLSERQCYALVGEASEKFHRPSGWEERVKELEAFQKMTTKQELQDFLQHHPISWYVLHPATQVQWPSSFKDNVVMQLNGYRLYHWKD